MPRTVQDQSPKVSIASVRYLHPERLWLEIEKILATLIDPRKRRDGHALLLRKHLAAVLDSVWNHPKWPVAQRVVTVSDWQGISLMFFCREEHDHAREAILRRFRARCDIYRDDGEHAYYHECEEILATFVRAGQWIKVQNRALVPYIFEDF